MGDPAVEAVERVEDICKRGLLGIYLGHKAPITSEHAAANEALRPIREMVHDQRLFGRGPHSQEWWDGVQYILEELDPLIYAKDCPCEGFGGAGCPQMESIGVTARPSYAPFAPADPKTCTCVDPFSDCPTHG